MPPAIIGGVVAGVGAIGAAALSSSAQKKAAKQASAAQQTASDNELKIAQQQEALFREIYANNEKNMTPYLNSGYGAQAVVEQALGLKPLTAEQFNKGEWYVPGTVDYSKAPTPAPTPTPSTGSGTPSSQTFEQLRDQWALGAINAMAPNVTRSSVWQKMNSISNPYERLQYLLSVSPASSDQMPLYNSYVSSNPMPKQSTTPAPAAGSTGSTQFPAQPAYGPSTPTNTQPTTSVQQQAQAAIAAGADPLQVSARLASIRNSGINQ